MDSNSTVSTPAIRRSESVLQLIDAGMSRLAAKRFLNFRSHWENAGGLTVYEPNSSDSFEHLIGHYSEEFGEEIDSVPDVILYLASDSQASSVRVIRWSADRTKVECHKCLDPFIAFLCSDNEVAKCELRRWAEVMKSCLLELTPATDMDAELLFRWVNDPAVRYAAFRSEQITWQDHCSWFERRLSDERSIIWIAHDNRATLIGQVRVDVDGGEGLVDISLDSSRRGQGWSTPILLATISRILETECFEEIQRLRAEILVANSRSIACFEQAGFELIGEAERNGKQYVTYIYEL